MIFVIGILIFLLLRSLCKISEPYDNPFWEKSDGGIRKKKERKKERRLIPTIVAYLRFSAGGTHFARTNLVRIMEHIFVNIKL